MACSAAGAALGVTEKKIMTVRRYYLLASPRLEGACVAFGGTRIDQVGEGLNALYALPERLLLTSARSE
jgi:hypothetical protein